MDWMLIISVLVIFIVIIWMFSKWNGLKSKIVAIFIISLILFSVFSLTMAFWGKNISVKNFSDVQNVAQIYFSWVSNAFNNVQTITSNVIKMDWRGNKTT